MPEKQEGFERTGRNPGSHPPVVQGLKFNSNAEFHTELRRRVNEYFRTVGRPQRGQKGVKPRQKLS